MALLFTILSGTYINNVVQAMFEYYRVFAKQIKPLLLEPEL